MCIYCVFAVYYVGVVFEYICSPHVQPLTRICISTPSHAPPISAQPQPVAAAPAVPVVSAENAALIQQQKRVNAEVASLRAKVTDAEAILARAPNPLMKNRAAQKLNEANDALKVKLDELVAVEAKLQ